jgi:DNA-binding NarL/FixJ family response regulator
MLEPARASEIAPLLLNAYGLTRRETEVTLLTLCGVAIDGIAAALSISPLTVQQHLKTVFDKTGVSSRRELVARIFAEQYRPMGQRRTSERPEAQQISIAWP